jgi:DNA-binding transcriptional LysR family regulator
MSVAADRLHLSQPTVSHHIAALEALIGGPIVTRSQSGSELTALGRTALVHAEGILDRTGAAERELRATATHGSSTLAVGSLPSAAAAFLAPSLAIADVAAGGGRFSVIVDEQPQLLSQLHKRELHLGLLAYDSGILPGLADDVSFEPIFEDPLVVLLPPSHAATHRPAVRLSDLTGDPWIVAATPDDPPRDALVRALSREGLELRVAQHIDDYAVTEALVAAGFGVALVPSIATGPLPGNAVIRPLVDTPLVRRIYVAWHNRPSSLALARLVEAIRTVARRTTATNLGQKP